MFAKTRTVDEALAGLSMDQFAPCNEDEAIFNNESLRNGVSHSIVKIAENISNKKNTQKPSGKTTWNKFIFDSNETQGLVCQKIDLSTQHAALCQAKLNGANCFVWFFGKICRYITYLLFL